MLNEIEQQAKKELQEEQFRAKVEEVKNRLRNKKPWYRKIFLYRIKLERID